MSLAYVGFKHQREPRGDHVSGGFQLLSSSDKHGRLVPVLEKREPSSVMLLSPIFRFTRQTTHLAV